MYNNWHPSPLHYEHVLEKMLGEHNTILDIVQREVILVQCPEYRMWCRYNTVFVLVLLVLVVVAK